MRLNIRLLKTNEVGFWDDYVRRHPLSNLYQSCAWKDIIENTYHHKTYYLVAMRQGTGLACRKDDYPKILGVLPLIHIRAALLAGNLHSMPFLDFGGILGNDKVIENELLEAAIALGKGLGAASIELRHAFPLSFIEEAESGGWIGRPGMEVRSHKVRMLMELPESSEVLMKSLRSKLRSQIRKPMKEGLVTRVGGVEFLEDFYTVFSVNMRDLGSPVHSKDLIKNVLQAFKDDARAILVYKDHQPVACALVIKFKEILENPWASSLREYSALSPNMLLYWSMLEFACESGCKYFDFGRSSPGEGTYRFKEQWGAKPLPLYWYRFTLNGKGGNGAWLEKSKFDKSIHYWKKLPEPVARMIGPRIRKYIAL